MEPVPSTSLWSIFLIARILLGTNTESGCSKSSTAFHERAYSYRVGDSGLCLTGPVLKHTTSNEQRIMCRHCLAVADTNGLGSTWRICKRCGGTEILCHKINFARNRHVTQARLCAFGRKERQRLSTTQGLWAAAVFTLLHRNALNLLAKDQRYSK
jgi:hypothetical protein